MDRAQLQKAAQADCTDCRGTGQIVGTPAANGLALAATCPTCKGSGRR